MKSEILLQENTTYLIALSIDEPSRRLIGRTLGVSADNDAVCRWITQTLATEIEVLRQSRKIRAVP